jgi:hypothetical protein
LRDVSVIVSRRRIIETPFLRSETACRGRWLVLTLCRLHARLSQHLCCAPHEHGAYKIESGAAHVLRGPRGHALLFCASREVQVEVSPIGCNFRLRATRGCMAHPRDNAPCGPARRVHFPERFLLSVRVGLVALVERVNR